MRKRKASRLPVILGALALVAAVSLGAGGYLYLRPTSKTGIVSYTIVPSNIDVKVKLSGELKATRNEEVRSAVEGVTTILSITLLVMNSSVQCSTNACVAKA